MSVSKNYQLAHVFCGLIAMWIIFLLFFIGFSSIKNNKKHLVKSENVSIPYFCDVYNWKGRTYIFQIIVCWLCSVLSARFYTGLNPLQVIGHIMAGDSLYAMYQKYFNEMGIATFSLQKIPYILMMIYLTVILFFSFLGVFSSGKKLRFKHYLYIVAIASSYYYFGICRGTNFEMYIIFVLIAYSLLCGPISNKLNLAKKNNKVLLVLVFGVIAVIVFRIVLTVRGSKFSNSICPEIQFNPESFVATVFPAVTNIGLSVFAYLGYGIYTMGVTVYNIIFSSFENVVSLMLPQAYELMNGQTLSDTLRETINVGVRWVPDWVNLGGSFGFPLFFVMIFLLGRFSAKCYSNDAPHLLNSLVCSIVFLFMLSLPVGNFIFASTPNVGLVCFAALWYMQNKYFHKRVRITLRR